MSYEPKVALQLYRHSTTLTYSVIISNISNYPCLHWRGKFGYTLTLSIEFYGTAG